MQFENSLPSMGVTLECGVTPPHSKETPKTPNCITTRNNRRLDNGMNEPAQKRFPAPNVINTLPLLEAQASSEIENIITTTDRLFQFRELDAQADPATKEALR